MTESRTEMLDRHARENSQTQERHANELAELDSRWWEEDFMEDPFISLSEKMGWLKETLKSSVHHDWIRHKLPTIIRKREKIGVKITMLEHMKSVVEYEEGMIYYRNLMAKEHYDFIVKLAGRTLAPGEKVEI